MLGPGIVAFITAAAGQLVWEDLQWGNGSQELFPGHDGAASGRLSCRDDLSSEPTPLAYRLEVPLQGRDNTLLSQELCD